MGSSSFEYTVPEAAPAASSSSLSSASASSALASGLMYGPFFTLLGCRVFAWL